MVPDNAEAADIIQLAERSPASEVLEALQLNDSVSSLEERVATLELDLERFVNGRDDDSRKVSGDLSIMRARVDDALNAFTDTAGDIQQRFGSQRDPDELIGEVVAGVGDAMTTMSALFEQRIASLGAEIEDARSAVERVAVAVGSLLNRVDRIDPARR